MDTYKWDCGCEIIVDNNGDVATKRCKEHKKKFPSPNDKESK